ncbi:aldo/keto reductase [candidate division KSB1 bacterium]|nr:MAG: aldo/keto reductase [candidate division KSB1 bacterium]
MQTRQLGNTDLHLSEIGFGAWAVGGGGYAFGWGEQDDRESIAAIHCALELGINWIDTAPVYGLGHSEEVVGKAIAGRRNEVIIATKCSLVWDENRNIGNSLRAESVKRECEESLKRLKIDTIDLYQIHWPSDSEHIEEGWRAIGDLISEGKIRYAGVSNFQYEMRHMHNTQAIRPMASLQGAYSMLRRYPEGEPFDYLREQKIGFLAYSPMQAGILTGRFSMSRVAQDDWRRNTPEYKEPNLSINLALVEALRPIAAKYGKTVAQLALAWVLRRPEVTSAIVGARRPSQIEETASGAGWNISHEDLGEIDELLEERKERVIASNGYLSPKEP